MISLAPIFEPIPQGHIDTARKAAANSYTSLMTALQNVTGLSDRELLDRLGETLMYRTYDAARLALAVPDFERLSYPECLKRKCLIISANEAFLILNGFHIRNASSESV